ncbi:isochorismate synthase [Streptosporangium carneum]|uniref:isochorismate synthase n=1 Tax=Streptosporangium carneum TaxID=47481 RepID=A0A9W6MG26_9ACTN|nr:isochorismate synthase [Streptosporangium carneum]GLK12700.1 isochorismate synthase DhbC [Streptosporangium carneum]
MAIAYEAVTASELLQEYRPGLSCLFSSPQHTLLGQGVADVVAPAATLRELAGRVRERASLVIGAVPFDDPGSAHLVVPGRTRWADPFVSCDTPAAEPAPPWRIVPVPSPADHLKGVRRALDLLERGTLDKVVLARSLELTRQEPVDVVTMVRRLAGRDPHGHVFAVPLPAGRTLVGASPELLVSRSGPAVVANPLAGSAPRGADPAEDRRRAAALLCSAKDQQEHAVVVEAVADTLAPHCRALSVPSEPSLVCTATMWHLSTRVTGRLTDPDTTSLDLAVALHPTPAVCGTPRAAARAAIAEIEPFDRGFYTGMVGWCDASGDGEWAVAIRCAEVNGTGVRLFAGGGIVAGSVPEDELAETSAKFRTLLDALGLNPLT